MPRKGRRAGLALFLVLLLSPRAAHADRRDQKAAELYLDGIEKIRKKSYREGIKKITEALDRGATEPNEQQGTESRFLARRYDPYYWLGVAQMELGLTEQALANFEKSESIVPAGLKAPVITKWPEEFADLKRRKTILLARLEAPGPTPPVIAAAPTATSATPVVVASLPTPRPTAPEVRPAATPTPFAIRVPTRPPVTPTPAPAGEAELASLRALRDDYRRLLDDPALRPGLEPLLAPRLPALEKLLASPPGERELKRRLDDERKFGEGTTADAIRRAALTASLDAFSRQRWADVERYAGLARKADPKAPQPDIVQCALLATRYLLEGRSDPSKIQEAREWLRRWREKTGAARPLPPFLSPAVREALK